MATCGLSYGYELQKGLGLRGSMHGLSTLPAGFHSTHSKGTPMAGGGQDH